LFGIGYLPAIPVTADEFSDAANQELWRKEKNMLVLKLWSDVHRRTLIDVFVLVAPEIAQFCEGFSASTRFDSEEAERSISCHPELAKDLTARQAALCQRSSSSKLMAPPTTPSVPKNAKEKVTLVRPREILRKLPMNLPLAGGRHPAFAVGRSSTRQRRGVRQSCAAFASRTDFRPTGRRGSKGGLRSECLIPSESVSR